MGIRKATTFVWDCPHCMFTGAALTKALAEWTLSYHLEAVHGQTVTAETEVY